MKYLIQHRKEFAISVGFFVMAVINLVRSIKSGEIGEDIIVTVIYTFFGVLAWYFNMPTSEENCEATGEMRQRKAEKKAGYIGEKMFGEDNDDI